MVFGKPTSLTKTTACGGIEVVQFGAHEERTAFVIDFARRMRSAFEQTTGAPPPGIGRIVVTEPGLGGTHVEGAITIGHPDLEPNERFDIGTAHFLAHEMFHSWLPGVLKPGQPGLEWFFEGFTDYFSLWHLASSGGATAQQFGDRLRVLELLAAQSPAFGSTRFDDPRGRLAQARRRDGRLQRRRAPGLSPRRRATHRGQAGSRHAVPRPRPRERLALHARGHSPLGRSPGPRRVLEGHVATGKLPDTGDALIRIGFVETFEEKNRILKDAPGTAPFFEFEPAAGT